MNIDRVAGSKSRGNPLTWAGVKQLLSQRMLVGIYIGQFCINTLTTFFLTWFPLYLVQARHMTILQVGFAAALPALCGSVGGILGGVCSDCLLATGHSLTFARKAPIIAGMLLSVTMIACNYTNVQALVMLLHVAGVFRQGLRRAGLDGHRRHVAEGTDWRERRTLQPVREHRRQSPRRRSLDILVKKTGSFNDALIFVGADCSGGDLQLLVIVGEIKRLEIEPLAHQR